MNTIIKPTITPAFRNSADRDVANFQAMGRKRIYFDDESKVIFFIILLSQLFFGNGLYLFICLLTIYLIFYYLQQPLKPGVFTLIALNHFAQIIAAVWQANSVDKDLNFRSPLMKEATVASCIGLLVMFFPIAYFQNKLPTLSWKRLKKDAYKLSTTKTFYCYLVSFFITNFLSSIAFVLGGLTQVIFSLVKVKWLFFLLFGYQCFLKKEKKNLFYIFAAVEFISGFFSFFSAFKTVIYYSVILFFGLLEVINLKKVIYGAILAVCLGLFALVWTGIKGQYRSYINGGSKNQVVAVDEDEALQKLYDLSSDVDEESLNSSSYQMLDRLQYTYHFAKTMERVPSIIPYQEGNNWLENLEFVTTPRILNPNKPTVDATEKARKYTGLNYSGKKTGASFSLGYFAECYVDFGLWGMMFLLALIGLMYGATFWYFMRTSSSNYIFNYCVVGAFFLEFSTFEMDGTILLGRFLATLVTFLVLKRFFFPWVMRYISLLPKQQRNEESA